MRRETPLDRARRIRQEARGAARTPRLLTAFAFAVGLLIAGFLLTAYVTGPLFGG